MHCADCCFFLDGMKEAKCLYLCLCVTGAGVREEMNGLDMWAFEQWSYITIFRFNNECLRVLDVAFYRLQAGVDPTSPNSQTQYHNHRTSHTSDIKQK